MSSEATAISVRGLSKAYRMAVDAGANSTLREAVMAGLRKPWARRDPKLFWALKDVSFDIHPGEVVGLVGRNGAGKSTLLKILSNITRPTAGAAHLYGRVGSLLEVGTGFHNELTGRENIFLNGAILGMRRKEIVRQFDAIVDFSGVEAFLDTPVKRYSSGMYVRLAFAVAAHLNPEILLVDEVLAVGDTEFQAKCLGKMGDVAKAGRTVILVSHNMAAIQQLCGRALLIQDGCLDQDGPPEHVIANYLSDAASADGDYDLAQHPARSKSHQPIIQRITLRAASGCNGSATSTATAHFFPDDGMTAELEIVPSAPIREPRVALAIEDAYGRRLMTLASYFEGVQADGQLNAIDGPCRVRCRLPRLNLGSGRYLISASISDKYNGLLDSIDNAAWIEVGWRNNYGNGEPYLPVYGPVIMPSTWERVN